MATWLMPWLFSTTAATSFEIIIDWTARPSSKKWSQ
jgi:hypothetical protein